jgi:hypothetical protein
MQRLWKNVSEGFCLVEDIHRRNKAPMMISCEAPYVAEASDEAGDKNG